MTPSLMAAGGKQLPFRAARSSRSAQRQPGIMRADPGNNFVRSLPRCCRWLAVAVIVLCCAPVSVRADAIWLERPTGAPIFNNVRITRVEAGALFFLVAGNETSRELSRVARISVDDEPVLNQAEEAFAAGNFDAAVDAYERVSRSSARAWVREWSTNRLVEASNRSGRFDAASAAYVALVLKDPSAAANARPKLPPSGSTYLDTAVSQVNAALSGARLTDAQRAALLTYLIELHAARKDEPAASRASQMLEEVLARDPNNPAAGRALARRKLQAASSLLAQKQFDRAIVEIESDRSVFTDPKEQVEALYLLAEARAGQALKSRDRTQLQDAALAYLRVVAHFKDGEPPPQVPLALLGAAALCQELGDSRGAARLYQQVIDGYPNQADAVSAAREALARLRQP
ncbi:MAG: tetratricopeptide repeat protein [Phycisphaerae bacterium]|nr:tetratricopeptide repeat protein [Phycisphaerae bacterium]MDW8262388.1 tetratricopeptide repeat protein [Phycisphaerales bacterium]